MAEPGELNRWPDSSSQPASLIPPKPIIMVAEWGDWAQLLIEDRHLSIGWQNRPAKKGGPCYLVGKMSAVLGSTKVEERFPFTDDGWAKSWRFLMRNDNTLASRIRDELATRAEAERVRQDVARLDASALVNLPAVTFIGGYEGEQTLAAGQSYDVRFFDDRLEVTRPREAGALVELRYAEVQALEVGGPGIVSGMSRGQQAGITLAFGLVGAAIAYTDTKIQTLVRIQTQGSELHFLCCTITPEALRIQLSRPLAAIRGAQEGQPPPRPRQDGEPAAAIAELSRLASLLETGLLTREEFDSLKSQLLAGP
jgi:hypothetical protein